MEREFKTDLGKSRVEVPGVLLYGLGAIGASAACYLVEASPYHLLGGVDIDPDGARQRLGDMADRLGPITPGPPGKAPGCAVALHMAGSHLPEIEAQLADLARAGYSVASSAEELTFPGLQHPQIAARLDALAHEAGVCIAGVGVNPGFVLDFLPVAATAVCRDIARVDAERVVDAATRREPLQRKVGCGMTTDEFEALARDGRIGHVGLIESCAFVADALALPIACIEEQLDPVVAKDRIRTEHFDVAPGRVCGIHHRAVGRMGNEVRVDLDLRMYLNAPDPHDQVHVHGRPELVLRIPAGTPGDFATVASLVNAIPRVAAAPPGLHTIKDLPMVV